MQAVRGCRRPAVASRWRSSPVVGRVRSVGKGSGLFKEVAVQPSANFEKIEEVMVATAAPRPPELTESVR